MAVIEQYFLEVLFIMLYDVVLTSYSTDETEVFSNERYCAVLSLLGYCLFFGILQTEIHDFVSALRYIKVKL